jgi:hypothetical protein
MEFNEIETKLINEVGYKNGCNWKDHIKFAQWIVKRKNPKVIVDLGVDYAYSTFSFSLPKIGKVYGIDSFEGDIHAGLKNEKNSSDAYKFVQDKKIEYGFDHLEFIKGYFDDVSKNWIENIDILHIDGLHTYESVSNDFITWGKFVNDDGIILMHDTKVYHGSFGVYKFFDELDYPKINFTVSHGLGVVAKNCDIINEIKTNFSDIVE